MSKNIDDIIDLLNIDDHIDKSFESIAKAAIEENTWMDLNDEEAIEWLKSTPHRVRKHRIEQRDQVILDIKNMMDEPNAEYNLIQDKTKARQAALFLDFYFLNVVRRSFDQDVGQYHVTIDVLGETPWNQTWAILWKTGRKMGWREALKIAAVKRSYPYPPKRSYPYPAPDKIIMVKLTHDNWHAYELAVDDPCVLLDNLISISRILDEVPENVHKLFTPARTRKTALVTAWMGEKCLELLRRTNMVPI